MPLLPDNPIRSPVVVGRAAPLAVLDRAVREALIGQGQVVLVAGEAGIGKSRLIAEVIARFRQLPSRPGGPPGLVLTGRCFAPDRAVPYAPLLDLWQTALAPSPPPGLAPALAEAGEAVAGIFPELAGPALSPAHPPPPAPPEKYHLFRALARVFTRLTARQPLLVVLEDLHWSDEASLDFLLYLARHLAGQPILLLLSYRNDEITPPLATFLAALDREQGTREVILDPLTRAEVDALVRAIFALPRPTQPAFRDALYALTEGNPLFVEETLKSLVAAGEIFLAGDAWDRRAWSELHIPRTIQVAVQQRMARLSPAAQRLLTVAAVAGRRFDFAVLQMLVGLDELAIVALIKELIVAQLVVEESAERFAFRHALTQQAVYAGLLERERQALHGTIARTLRQLHATRLEPVLADLAYHFTAAGAWAEVLPVAWQAGAQAAARYAPLAAVEQFTRALAAAAPLGQTAPAALYRARGQAHEVLGDFAAAEADYAAARAAAADTADARVVTQSVLDLGWLWTGRDYGRAGTYFAEAITQARGLGDPQVLAETLNRVGNWQVMTDHPAQAQTCHAEALALYEAADDAPGQAATLDLLGITRFMTGDVPGGVGYLEQAVNAWRALDARQGLAASLMALAMRGASYMFLAQPWLPADATACVRDGEEAIALARQIGWPAGEAAALVYLGMALGPRGAYARAFAVAQEGLALATELEHRIWQATGLMCLGALALDLLDAAAAQAALEQALAAAQAAGAPFVVRGVSAYLARAYLVGRDVSRAAAVLDATGIPPASTGEPPASLAQRLVAVAQAELALAQDQPALACRVLDQLQHAPPPVPSAGAIPQVGYLYGAALLALDQPAAAARILQEAQAVAAAQEARPLRWRIAATLGRVHTAQHQPGPAAAAFATARTILLELAAEVPDLAMRETFLRQARAQVPGLPRAGVTPPLPGGLTRRERDVAARVARGEANRVIATALVLSERTVEKHVENILLKLGFQSRAQIAAWATAQGLVTIPPE
jgi:DNA-binding CsgD family transcriptional regulator/tetratricopeptide (TPR) repeat protein